MEQNNKYYTPEKEELTVGFECQFLSYRYDDPSWINYIIKESDFKFDIFKNHELGLIRCKYLDKDEIESIPLCKTNKDQCYGFEDYYSGDVNPNYGYFLYYTLHVPKLFNKSKKIQDNLFKIILHRHFISNNDETTNIDEQLKNGESKVVFEGVIKNLSKLRTVLKDLRIVE